MRPPSGDDSIPIGASKPSPTTSRASGGGSSVTAGDGIELGAAEDAGDCDPDAGCVGDATLAAGVVDGEGGGVPHAASTTLMTRRRGTAGSFIGDIVDRSGTVAPQP
jgi:hypothetical protein